MKQIVQLLDDYLQKNGQLCTYFSLQSLEDNEEHLLLEILDMRLTAGPHRISD